MNKLSPQTSKNKKEEKDKPFSVKFETKDDSRYKLVADGKTYEGKLSEFGIPVEELGFDPLVPANI